MEDQKDRYIDYLADRVVNLELDKRAMEHTRLRVSIVHRNINDNKSLNYPFSSFNLIEGGCSKLSTY